MQFVCSDSAFCSGMRGLKTSSNFQTFSIIKRKKPITVYIKYITFSIKRWVSNLQEGNCNSCFVKLATRKLLQGTYFQFVSRQLLSLTLSRLRGKYFKLQPPEKLQVIRPLFITRDLGFIFSHRKAFPSSGVSFSWVIARRNILEGFVIKAV